ncbi:MAG: carbon-nitrogen hydrolase family protein [Alphaproteobacteria bacterium]
MKLSLIQMNGALGREKNVDKACRLIAEAAVSEKPDLVVLPEFFNMMYAFQYRDYRYIDWAERDDGHTMSRMREKAREHGIHIVATIFEEEAAGVYYDTAMIIDPDGGIIGKYRKVQPAAVRSLEKIYFRYGSYFPVFSIGGWRVGINICYDTAFPESARCTAINGAELIVAPFAAPERNCWREMMVTRAFENGLYFAPCNKVGEEGDWVFAGRSMIVDPAGEVVAEADDATEQIISATLDRDAVYQARRARPVFRDRRPELYKPLCMASEDIPRID